MIEFFLELRLHIKNMFFSGKKSNGAQIMDVLFLQNNIDSSVQELSAPLPLSAEGDNFPSQILKI